MDEGNGATLNAVNTLGLKRKDLSERKDECKRVLEQLNQDLRDVDAQIIFALQENGMDKYSIPGYGTAYLSKRLSYKVPKEPQAREAFFRFLKERGVFEDLITVHSQTLNSWAKKEVEVTNEACGIDSFSIPGLGDPTYSETLGVRKS